MDRDRDLLFFRNDQLLDLQFSALDCNGVSIFSKHPILSSKFVKFTDNVDVLDEKLVQRGFIAATIKVRLRGRGWRCMRCYRWRRP